MDFIRRIISNVWFGGFAAICGIVSLVFTIIGESKLSREVAFLPSPQTVIVVKAGAASDIVVTYKGNGKEIKGDITAAQFSIWNNGELAAKHDHILEPIVVSTEPTCPILEATIRKTSRDVVGLSLDTSRLDQGKVGVDWKILEHGDGGIIQIIFAGTPSVRLMAKGILEGQREILKSDVTDPPWIMIAFFGAFFMWMSGGGWPLLHDKPQTRLKIGFAIAGLILAVVVYLVDIHYQHRNPYSPFDPPQLNTMGH